VIYEVEDSIEFKSPKTGIKQNPEGKASKKAKLNDGENSPKGRRSNI
jgi:hypothetical protein